MFKKICLTITGATLLLYTMTGNALGDAPQQVVRGSLASLFTAVREEGPALRDDTARLRALVADKVTPHLDLELTAKWILGKHWRRATPAQRSAFVTAFRALLIRTYATAVTEFARADIRFLPTRKTKSNRATVPTRMSRGSGKPVAIDYRLNQGPDGWRVYDVVIEGISLIHTYRKSFSAHARQYGLDNLIEVLAIKAKRSTAG